jgi:hypothetical protein
MVPEIKLPEREETDLSPPSRTEIKNAWSYTVTPPYVFMVRYLVKRRYNF